MKVERVNEFVWEIPKTEKPGMNVPARIYANKTLFDGMDDGVFEQVTNIACMPGIQRYALAMPDAHQGYGSPVGGVAAFDLEEGVISPGVIGFDVNCGMRLLKTNLTLKDVQPKIRDLVNRLFELVPAGVGRKGTLKLSRSEMQEMMVEGVPWIVRKGFGWKNDAERIEEKGRVEGANPAMVSKEAFDRGMVQLGTLGSGNHYLEVQVVREENVFDWKAGKAFGLEEGLVKEGQIFVMVHCGSRGFGHQICTDYVREFEPAMKKYGLNVKDRELACAPFASGEGKRYYAAMACASNYAFCNRQAIIHNTRLAFERVLGQSAESMGMEIVYDVAHNIAKVEEHKVEGKRKKLVVHRKGSTRSFGPGQPELAEMYRGIGQPVIVGGSMETGSFVCAGTEKAMDETFGSTMHGSGRTMSRAQAKKEFNGGELLKRMERQGIFVKSASTQGLAEEAGGAYKSISEVVDTMDKAGISRKVFGLKPIGNIKG
ncbi:MAG: RtcB family protein [Candidatus Diapherotrites archaeon]|nr:RtcB family protein [Candidatus Diapherotrites archaeon]